MPQQDCEAVRLLHGAGKNDDCLTSKLVHQVDEVCVLVLEGDEQKALYQGGHSAILAADLDAHRTVETRALQLLHLARHCCREQVRIACLRDHLQDFIKDRPEVHVQQPVGFVHHEVFQRAQRKALCVLQVIEKASGGCDDHVRLLAQRHRLCHHVHSADDDGTAHTDSAAEGFELFRYLKCEFTSGGENTGEESRGVVPES